MMKASAGFETKYARGNIDTIYDGTTLCEVTAITQDRQERVTLSGRRSGAIVVWDQDIPRWAVSTVHALTRLIGIVPSFDDSDVGQKDRPMPRFS
jgi:hypothetical protein